VINAYHRDDFSSFTRDVINATSLCVVAVFIVITAKLAIVLIAIAVAAGFWPQTRAFMPRPLRLPSGDLLATMIGYGKLGLLIECYERISVSACAVRIVGVDCIRPSAFRCKLMVCCTFSPTKLHFCPEFSYHHSPFSRKKRFLVWHIACASYLSRGN
jgi:hypothetical protein